MLISNGSALNILLANNNRVLNDALKEADNKTLNNLLKQDSSNSSSSTNTAASSILKEVLNSIKDGTKSNSSLENILKNSTAFKDLGNLSSNLSSLLESIKDDESLQKFKPLLESFLKNINNVKENEQNKNIDFYYMNNTFKIIKEWFTENKINKGDFLNILLKVNIIEENKQKIDIANNVRVIWYEIDDENEIDVFTRLNIGKIPLTNAELIKAIFLINTEEKNEKLLLASQWDEIEYKLQDNSFFAFVSKDFDKNNELKYPTRIEFIFDLIANKSNLEINNLQKDDERRSYYIFNELIKDNNTAKEYWDEVKKYFRVFNEFYSNQKYYHLVGFLVHNGVKIVEIVENFMNNSKDNFLNILKEKIKQKNQLKKKVFEELNYEEDYDLVTRILFLFNVISTMKSNHSRYPFNLHKSEKWSLEHIHAQKSENITKIEDRKDLLKMQLTYIDDKTIKKDIEDLLELEKITEEQISDIENRVSKLFTDKEIHTIDNLALLSRDDNSSLNNSIFPAKRDKIKELDKTGSFIPICTKNVFLKYYSITSPINNLNYSIILYGKNRCKKIITQRVV